MRTLKPPDIKRENGEVPENDTANLDMTTAQQEVSVEGYTGSGSTVFMYSATSGDGGVTLQLRDSDEMDDKSEGLGSVLARIHHQPDNTLSISYPSDIDGSIDVLLATSTLNTSGDAGSGGFDLFDSDNGQDLTLSPQTFTSSTEAFINDNSNSLGVSCNDNDTVGSTEDVKAAADSSKLAVKKARPKPASPNRQGPQQCQVCGKVFGNASALAKHKLTHSDERKYVCAMCAKAFKRQDHLNGHMLTHRNKKPYECKAEGCGKSYCDARSLRRHRENHHAAATAPTSTTPSPVSEQNSPPLSSSCIQYAPPPPPKPSQLQQLLATQPSTDNKSSSGQNNDGLTKQQLELIQQIMQQTKEQAAAAAAKTSSASGNAKTVTTTSTTQPATTTATCKPKIWTVQTSPCLTKAVATSTKPVECNLCHRKFKNIPALNGHMRLHGGYFKKDSESKKNEKKEVTGPPLQTASISVRALIEEKIIQKRITNPSLATHTQTNLTYSNDNRTGNAEQLPATPPSDSELTIKTASFVVPSAPGDKGVAPHVESDRFLPPRTPGDGLATSAANTIPFGQVLVKRTNKSGVKRASSDPGILKTSETDGSNHLQLSLQNDGNYSLDVYNDEADYFTPALHEEVFQHVQSDQDSMLLQGVDPAQLAETIQVATLQDIASLEEYQSTGSPQSFQHHQDIQSVLDSPLPVGLADFAYSHSRPTSSESPPSRSHTYGTSPLASPSFTYPTPPASQEGQSPSLAPLQSVISHGSGSSPLSAAAFYTSAMSSSAAVEAALNEVLPQQPYPSPPSQSPVPSPLSLPPSSSSPLPHHTLQSQMMPNSEDPLLSSSPKDFATRKKFDFQTFKLLNNGTIDLGAQGVAGIVLDRNGELKLVQTSCLQPVKSALMEGATVFVNKPSTTLAEGPAKFLKTVPISTKTVISEKVASKAPLHIIDDVKEEIDNDVFLSPSIPSSPVRLLRKRPRLDISQPPYQSRLRAVRVHAAPVKQMLYTPPPMLHPSRQSHGLYWQAVTTWPSSTTTKGSGNDDGASESSNGVLESDTIPHVNIGAKYQCVVPTCVNTAQVDTDQYDDYLLWDTRINNIATETEIDMYLEFACCAAVPGGGRNKEYALHILHLCKGNVHEAMLKLMQPTPSLPEGHPLLNFEYSDSDRWNAEEMETFHQALMKYEKDFSSVAQEVGSKTTKQCIQFYYLWKKVCPEEYKKSKLVRKKHREIESETEISKIDVPANDVEIVSTSSESRLFVCEYPDCSASFNSRAALNGHIRIHVGGTTGRCPTPDKRSSPAQMSIAETAEEYPCKICGKIFNKVKSRSAHMKSHRSADSETRKPKLDSHKLEIAEQSAGRSMGVSSSSTTVNRPL